MGNSEITAKRLNEILAQAGLTGLVDSLPERSQSIIGRQGMFTTWQERYRIALARCLIADLPIVVILLPQLAMPKDLTKTISELIQNEWSDRIVVALTSQAVSGLNCDHSIQVPYKTPQLQASQKKGGHQM